MTWCLCFGGTDDAFTDDAFTDAIGLAVKYVFVCDMYTRSSDDVHARTHGTHDARRCATHTRASHRVETPVRGAPSEGLER